MTTVLVVEDDPLILALLTTLLEEEGYTVRTATNGTAIRLAAAERPALILLDLNLPGMDGIEISKRLRADPRTRTIPIVLMSASEHLRERGRQAPVDELIAKPFELDTLLECIDQYTSA